MKCPHCGMNIRDNIAECGYCGGIIVQESEKSTSGSGRPNIPGGSQIQKGASIPAQSGDEEPGEDEEEEGGLSAYLQKDEHVLIGSLNITVKKFFFHAYLTDKRVFLIDTQEKKVKVTAKDIPRDTIIGSIVEFSENSDPVLVLSIRSLDDEIKTMKLVFVQNGMERSAEIDEWIALLHEEEAPAELPSPKEEEISDREEAPAPAEPEKPARKQELQPKRMPAKDHEKQPPVKRHLAARTVEEEEETPAPEPSHPQRRAQVREMPSQESERPSTVAKPADIRTARKSEVPTAMKVAMKSAMQPLKRSSFQPSKRPFIESESQPEKEPEPGEKKGTQKRPAIHEKSREAPEEGAEIPQFCHNCGKKLPLAANFCPGCGTRLSLFRTLPRAKVPETPAEKKTPAPPAREKKTPRKEETGKGEKGDESPVPPKPPARKSAKDSDMTILHKFLRR